MEKLRAARHGRGRDAWWWPVLLACLVWWCLPAVMGFEPPREILCTTFPVYQFTRTVTQGRAGVTVSLMLPAGLGCPHDYALTPQDLVKVAKADVLVINGLGMEEFLGAPIKRANANLRVIDSSTGIAGVQEYGACGDAHGHGDACDHPHHGVNPHLFASPRLAARLVANIAAELSKMDPEGAATYLGNAMGQISRLEALAAELAAVGKKLKNRRIVTQHGVFDYLARDMGLEIVAVVQAHPGQEPSAAEMLAIVKAIREKQAAAVFTEPQYPAQIGRAIAREAGVPVGLLDPVASGPDDAGPDYYEQVMRQNLATIISILGIR